MAVAAVLQRIIPLVEKEVKVVLNSKEEIKDLESKLNEIQTVLQDAERRGVTDADVKRWLDKLQDLAYEMDDVLDEWETANLKLEIQESARNNANWAKRVSLFVQSLSSCCKHVVRRRSTVFLVEDLMKKLDQIVDKKNEFNFVASRSDDLGESKRSESISWVDESKIYGRECDKERVVRKLLLFEGEENGTKIVSVVGGGGLGKTTLAQLVYNDDKVVKHFEFRAWVCVSDPFDVRAISEEILKAGGMSPSRYDRLNMNMLLECVKDSVFQKKFLIILDDVWTDDYRKWEPLEICLKGLPGSRILVTTRNERVAIMMGSCDIQKLGQLTVEDCWSILSQRAFSWRSGEDCKELEDIGRKIAIKCQGIPLVAKSTGSMLAFRKRVQQWQEVLDSPLWDWEEVEKDVSSILNLSYGDLSPVLKCCFSSCAIFSKDEMMNREELLRIWLAHGYVSSKGKVDKVHSKAMQYFENLAMRSFFQDLVEDDDAENDSYATMHDMMHDFAIALSKREYHVCMDGSVEDGNHDCGIVRSFCSRSVSQQELTPSLFRRLRRVRILMFDDCKDLQELPREIGELTHLRYLQFRETTNHISIRALPETLCDLHNLQTLDLVGCRELSSLPQKIHKLINLRHFLLYKARTTLSFEGIQPDMLQLKPSALFHKGLARLTGLWTLNCFDAGRGSGKLGYLKNMNQLRGELRLFLGDMDKDDDLLQAAEARLDNKIYIQELLLVFAGRVRMDVTNSLQMPPNLKRLLVSRYRYNQFPDWITSLNSLKVFEFYNCDCSALPLLGKLPKLEKIHLYYMYNLEYLGNEFLGIQENTTDFTSSSSIKETIFPSLKKLLFFKCDKWGEWKDVGEEVEHHSVSIMPSLEEIEIVNCSELKTLPHRLLRMASSLSSLSIARSERLTDHYIEGEGRDMISHIPTIRTDFHYINSGKSDQI